MAAAVSESQEMQEIPLFRAKGAPVAPSVELARRRKKEEERAARLVPTDPVTGENAGDIMGAWVSWYQQGSGLMVPPSITSRLGKQVKLLLSLQYTATEIKHALSFWTILELQDQRIRPEELQNLAFRYARDTRAQAASWRQNMLREASEFSRIAQGYAGTGSRKQLREANNASTARSWESKGLLEK